MSSTIPTALPPVATPIRRIRVSSCANCPFAHRKKGGRFCWLDKKNAYRDISHYYRDRVTPDWCSQRSILAAFVDLQIPVTR